MDKRYPGRGAVDFAKREEVKRLREEGKTYAQIGKEIGISRQRVHQLLKEVR
jgi:DNA-binding CsgD family transcriptional regulator